MIILDCSLHQPCSAHFQGLQVHMYDTCLSGKQCSSRKNSPDSVPLSSASHMTSTSSEQQSKASRPRAIGERRDKSKRRRNRQQKGAQLTLTWHYAEITPLLSITSCVVHQYGMQDKIVLRRCCDLAKIAVSECQHDFSQSHWTWTNEWHMTCHVMSTNRFGPS